MEPVNAGYRWEDIDCFAYDIGDKNSKTKLILYLNSGKKLHFYCLGFKEYGDLPLFYRKLLSQLPEKERKSKKSC